MEVGGGKAKGRKSPVKFATLVFFKEFNGASRGRRAKDQMSEVGGQRARRQRAEANQLKSDG